MTDDNNQIKVDAKSASDPIKTESTITGGEPFKKSVKNIYAVDAKTTSDPNDPTKTLVTLSKPVDDLEVTVIGPFNGKTKIRPGTQLRTALQHLNNEDNTFGQFKYRNSHDEPVSILMTVEEDLILTSILKS